MGKIANLFKAHLDNKNIKYTYYEPTEKRNEAIRITYNCKNISSVSVTFFFDKSGSSVNIKCFSIAAVQTEKLMNIYVLLNELNSEYRWVKFYIDSDNEVTVSGDAILDEATVGAECEEILFRYIDIIDDVYPRIMKALWA